jgi:predicted nucleic acid-binding protein
VIYLDSSVLLASIFQEQRSPPVELWEQELTASRLLEYEVWTRLNAYGLAASHGARAKARLDRVNFVELNEWALVRALAPFPVAVRTLDALHLATMTYLHAQGQQVELSSYDNRLIAAAAALDIPLAAL